MADPANRFKINSTIAIYDPTPSADADSPLADLPAERAILFIRAWSKADSHSLNYNLEPHPFGLWRSCVGKIKCAFNQFNLQLLGSVFDIDFPHHRQATGRHGSTSRQRPAKAERLLPLWQETVATIRAWIAVTPKDGDTALFLNNAGRMMTRSGF